MNSKAIVLEKIRNLILAGIDKNTRGLKYPEELRDLVHQAFTLDLTPTQIWRYCRKDPPSLYSWLSLRRRKFVEASLPPQNRLPNFTRLRIEDQAPKVAQSLDEHVWLHLSEKIYVELPLRLLSKEVISRISSFTP